jgi:predicted transcriptional regulator
MKRGSTLADGEDRLRELVAQVAASYFSNSQVSPLEISSVMSQIAASLAAVSANDADPIDPPMAAVRATTAQVRKSITHEALISFEDGLPRKTLRRHLAALGLSPEQYRAKWGLPDDYPMVSAAYSEHRAQLALGMGLGRKDRGWSGVTQLANGARKAPR